jgi:hypothetical protein
MGLPEGKKAPMTGNPPSNAAAQSELFRCA